MQKEGIYILYIYYSADKESLEYTRLSGKGSLENWRKF